MLGPVFNFTAMNLKHLGTVTSMSYGDRKTRFDINGHTTTPASSVNPKNILIIKENLRITGTVLEPCFRENKNVRVCL